MALTKKQLEKKVEESSNSFGKVIKLKEILKEKYSIKKISNQMGREPYEIINKDKNIKIIVFFDIPISFSSNGYFIIFRVENLKGESLGINWKSFDMNKKDSIQKALKDIDIIYNKKDFSKLKGFDENIYGDVFIQNCKGIKKTVDERNYYFVLQQIKMDAENYGINGQA